MPVNLNKKPKQNLKQNPKQNPAFRFALLAPRYLPIWAALCVLWLMSWLPRKWIMRLGAWCGECQFQWSKKRRHIAKVNLDLCFPDLSERRREQILRDHFRNLGSVMLDLGLVMMANNKRVGRFSQVKGLENLQSYIGVKPIILISFHTTTLEMCASSILADVKMPAGVKMFAMMKRDKNPVLNWFMYHTRTRKNVIVYMRHQGLRGVLSELQKGRIFYIIPDEDFGDNKPTVFAPFLGQQSSTLNIIGRLARKTGAVVIPSICRLNPKTGHYVTTIAPAITNFPSGNEVADATAINHAMEKLILKAPEQYMWTFRWFKTRPSGQANPYK